jgi:hypothetical protein
VTSHPARTVAGSYAWTLGSTALVGALGLVALAVAARWLGAEQYAPFAVTWGLYYGIGGVFAGLQHETTRTVTVHGGDVATSNSLLSGALLLILPVAVGGGLVAGIVSTSAATALVLAVGLGGFGLLTLVLGVLAAQGRWRDMAVLLTVDAATRAVALALAAFWDVRSAVPAAIVSGSVVWVALLGTTGLRQVVVERMHASPGQFMRKGAFAMAGSGCAAMTLAGLPVLVAIARPGEMGSLVGATLAAVMWIRSALLMLVYGLRPLLLRSFLAASSSRGPSPWLLVTGMSLAYVVLGATVLPTVLPWILGEEFRLTSLTCGLIAFGAAGMSLLVVAGLKLLSVDRHLAATAGWVGGLAGTGSVLLLAGGTPSSVIVNASWAGPWSGVLVHGLCLIGPSVAARRA